MNFMDFYNEHQFTLFAIGDSNWDLYLMSYKDNKPRLVSIAKPDSGAKDSGFGDVEWFEKFIKQNPNHGFIKV